MRATAANIGRPAGKARPQAVHLRRPGAAGAARRPSGHGADDRRRARHGGRTDDPRHHRGRLRRRRLPARAGRPVREGTLPHRRADQVLSVRRDQRRGRGSPERQGGEAGAALPIRGVKRRRSRHRRGGQGLSSPSTSAPDFAASARKRRSRRRTASACSFVQVRKPLPVFMPRSPRATSASR